MPDRSNEERIAVLENQVAELHEMRNDIKEIKDQLTKYKGILGGVTLTLSILWAGVLFFKDLVMTWLSKT